MQNALKFLVTSVVSTVLLGTINLYPQTPDAPPPRDGFGPNRGGPGPGGVQEDTKLVKDFDKDGNKRLDATERKAAREFLEKEKAEGRGPRRPGPRGPRNENSEPVAKGEKLSPADVKSFPGKDLYDPSIVRTFFIEFENADWENELADFYRTDVEVPAKITVDGKTYRDVGVHFRGASSFFTVAEGRKRSLNLSFDFADEKQNIGGYRTLNLLNSHTDPTYLRTLLYSLIKTLSETPTNKLEAALAPMLDIDGTLKFLALENALINSDGYWTRASDYLIYRDDKGIFHLVPYDANETFRPPGGPGGPRRGGGEGERPRGVSLDPFTGATDQDKPLLSRLLAVPSLRARYLGYVQDIAQKWLDWKKLEPIAKSYQALIAEDVKKDTHKLYPFEAFQNGLTTDVEEQGERGPRQTISLKTFADQRRAFLLSYKP